MKISVEYNNVEVQDFKIKSARYLGDFAIRILFNDDTERLVDFKSFLTKSLHPSIQKYLNEDNFSKFLIKDGNLNWNDYDMIFPIIDLYNGEIE